MSVDKMRADRPKYVNYMYRTEQVSPVIARVSISWARFVVLCTASYHLCSDSIVTVVLLSVLSVCGYVCLSARKLFEPFEISSLIFL